MENEQQASQHPALWFAIASIVIYFVLQIAGGVAAIAIAAINDPILADAVMKKAPGYQALILKSTVIEQLLALIMAAALTLMIIWFYLKRSKSRAKIGIFQPSRLSLGQTIKLVFLTYGAAILLTLAWGMVLAQWKGENFDPQSEINAMIKSISWTPETIAAAFGAVAIMGPLIEEVMFRGLLQNALGRYVSPATAILIAAAVFGSVHLQPYAFPALFALGAALGYIYHRTGSLALAAGLHMANNGIALAFGA